MFLCLKKFKCEQYTIPNHQKIKAHKQAKEAPEVRDEGLEGVGQLLLLGGQGRARESDADYRRVGELRRDNEGIPCKLNKENFCKAQVQVKFGSYQTFVQHFPLKLFSNMLPTQGGCKRD